LRGYSRGISSARALARQSQFEPGLLCLCGLQSISDRTLYGFRSDYQVALSSVYALQGMTELADSGCSRNATEFCRVRPEEVLQGLRTTSRDGADAIGNTASLFAAPFRGSEVAPEM
jgi:hypothetical protein